MARFVTHTLTRCTCCFCRCREILKSGTGAKARERNGLHGGWGVVVEHTEEGSWCYRGKTLVNGGAFAIRFFRSRVPQSVSHIDFLYFVLEC